MLHLYCSNLDMKNAHILLPDGYNWFKSRVWTKLVLGIQIYGLVYKKGALVFQVTLFKETNNILITDHEIKEDQKEVYFLYKPIQISLLVYLFDLHCIITIYVLQYFSIFWSLAIHYIDQWINICSTLNLLIDTFVCLRIH